ELQRGHPAILLRLRLATRAAPGVIFVNSDYPRGEPTVIDSSKAVASLFQSRLLHEAGAPITEQYPALSLDEAYTIQRALEAKLEEQDEQVIGWKVGLTNVAFQQNWGLGEPVAAFMLGSGVFGSGDAIPVSRFVG